MSIPPPRGHDPDQRDAEEQPVDVPVDVEVSTELLPVDRYPWTTGYLLLMVTLILFAVLFQWRL